MKILRTIIKSTAESGLTGHRASLRLVFTACELGLWSRLAEDTNSHNGYELLLWLGASADGGCDGQETV